MPETSPLIAAALDDRYIIERELGAGGMAIVYLARDKKLDRDVALKVLRPELGAVLGAERFLAEIKISARLDHPHILTLIDSGEAGGFLYYVLPYVRGESLRTKLDRERQLPLEEAIAITKQVASALDYAHRQGLVHRDIKPENILIQEGEAMLADFGIALAVTEAGGNRLTQTGLSLGTPQYMSPEQATGDRGVDARSDVYSLAAVLYEMLAGEPPVTGSSAQSMIAKLMTEKPTHLRVLRDSIPVTIDEAVAKALSKTPADRYTSAGAFVRALEQIPTIENAQAAQPTSRKKTLMYAGIVGVLALAALGAAAASGKFSKREAPAVLGKKTQLTTSGEVFLPAISPDGKQLAYLVKHCSGSACTFNAVVQDVGGSTTLTILEGATAGYTLSWSPDRRNIEFEGTIAGRSGSYLLSALGGAPRFLSIGTAAFYAGGDSLLISPNWNADSVFYIRVASLDGVVHDSIRVTGPGQSLAAISSVPGTNWILTLVIQSPHGLWQMIDRSGKVADRVVNACTCGGLATSDAVWLARAGDAEGESIVRIGIDRNTGKFAARQDTMVTGLFSNFSLTSDGAGMLMDEGTFEHNLWALDLADLLKGHFAESQHVAHSSSAIYGSISPDGSRILMRRTVPIGAGHVESHYGIMPFAGGAETPLPGVGNASLVFWIDSVTVGTSSLTPKGLDLAEVDVRSGARRNVLSLPDSTMVGAAALPNGWIWIPATRDRFVLSENGKKREIKVPAWYRAASQIVSDLPHNRVLFEGYNRATGDSLGVGSISLPDGAITHWTAFFAEGGAISPLDDGSISLTLAETQESRTLFRLLGPGQIQRLGMPSRPLVGVSISADGRRGTAYARDYHADAWLSQVVRPEQ